MKNFEKPFLKLTEFKFLREIEIYIVYITIEFDDVSVLIFNDRSAFACDSCTLGGIVEVNGDQESVIFLGQQL